MTSLKQDMTFVQYCKAITIPHKNQRKGQRAFNLLYKVRPRLAKSIRDTYDDPFYKDEILPYFLSRIEKDWDATR